MKNIFKTLAIALVSSVGTGLILLNQLKEDPKEIQPQQNTVIPTAYSYNSSAVKGELTDFTIAAEKTVNTVVHVKNTSVYGGGNSYMRLFYGEEPKRIGTGSGVIVSPDGYILTNHHVIEDATEIEITTNHNKKFKAELIGSDPVADIAVLKIETDRPLPAISFGNSDNTRVGEWVLAVGNPFNLNSTVTAGIISAKSRDLSEYDGKNESYIQTDAAVNQGNSGGALVNTRGELIGINTAISSISGVFVGYSFAVPSNIARKIFEDILEYGNVQKGLLGVQGSALDADVAKRLEIDQTEGFYIAQLVPDMGAEAAGLSQGDVITSIDQVNIRKFSDLSGYLSSKRPNDKVKVTFIRNGIKKQLDVVLKKVLRATLLGMELRNLNSEEKENLGEEEPGVLIDNNRNYRLRRYGIESGYRIARINNEDISTVDDINRFDPEDINSILFVSPTGTRERILFN